MATEMMTDTQVAFVRNSIAVQLCALRRMRHHLAYAESDAFRGHVDGGIYNLRLIASDLRFAQRNV